MSNKIISNLKILSKEMEFRYDPNVFHNIGGVEFTTLGIIKDYGSANGTVLFELMDPVVNRKILRSEGYYFSCISECYEEHNIELIKETLNDWGFYGPIDLKPDWFSGYSY